MDWHNVILRPSNLYEELLRRKLIGGGGSSILKTITGISPLTITDIASRGIKSLTQFGKCGQNGTPTPSVPVDITCNNGVIKFSPNICDVKESTVSIGYYIASTGTVRQDPNNWLYSEYVTVKPNTKYTLSADTALYFLSISEYSTPTNNGFIRRNASPTGSNTSLSITTGANTQYIRFGSNIKAAPITTADVLAIKWILNEGAAPLPYAPYVEGGIYIDGTPEVLTIASETTQTANAANLFGVSDYQDEHEIVGGHITKRLGIMTFDGTETWTTDTYGGYRRMVCQEVLNASGDTLSVTCSHYASRSVDARQQPNSIFMASSGKIVIYVDTTQNINTVDEFNAFLAQQYANGTPVIIVYPLAEPTTESATPQHIAARDTATITAASDYIDNIDLKVEYWKKTN